MSALRRSLAPLGVLAAVLAVYMENPFLEPPEEVAPLLGFTFWALVAVIGVAVLIDRTAPATADAEVQPSAVGRLFGGTGAGAFWLPIRMFVGFSWLAAGLEKLFPADKAIGAGWLDGGASLAGYWGRAVAIPEAPARAAISYDWYRDFLNFLLTNDAQTWFAYLIVFGEIAVGLGLIFGGLTWIAGFFGATMNMSFMLAGSSSSNPVLFLGAVALIAAWRVAGSYGLDRYLLPALSARRNRRALPSPVPGKLTTPPIVS